LAHADLPGIPLSTRHAGERWTICQDFEAVPKVRQYRLHVLNLYFLVFEAIL